MHLHLIKRDGSGDRVRLKQYIPPPPLLAHTWRPMAVVVAHQDGRVRVAYAGYSLDGIEKMARRVWCFIQDWRLPMAVWLDLDRDGYVTRYEPSPYERTNARAGRRIDEGPLPVADGALA